MELQDFIKTKKTQKFLDTTYSSHIYSKSEILGQIEEKIKKWLADGCSEKEIKKDALSYVLRDFEPITSELNNKTKKLMSKWGLK